MDNHKIDALLKSHPQTEARYVGCYAFDNVPELHLPAQTSSFVVLNQDPKDRPGSHWIVCEINVQYREFDGNLLSIYFDSYGHPPPPHMKAHLQRILGNNFLYNQKEMQGLFSTTCGQWCMLYILQRCKGQNLEKFLNMFSSNRLVENDKIVNKWIETEFNTREKVLDTDFIRKRIKSQQTCRQRCANELCVNQGC